MVTLKEGDCVCRVLLLLLCVVLYCSYSCDARAASDYAKTCPLQQGCRLVRPDVCDCSHLIAYLDKMNFRGGEGGNRGSAVYILHNGDAVLSSEGTCANAAYPNAFSISRLFDGSFSSDPYSSWVAGKGRHCLPMQSGPDKTSHPVTLTFDLHAIFLRVIRVYANTLADRTCKYKIEISKDRGQTYKDLTNNYILPNASSSPSSLSSSSSPSSSSEANLNDDMVTIDVDPSATTTTTQTQQKTHTETQTQVQPRRAGTTAPSLPKFADFVVNEDRITRVRFTVMPLHSEPFGASLAEIEFYVPAAPGSLKDQLQNDW